MPEYMLTSQSCSCLYSLNCFAKSNLHVEQPILITFLVVALRSNALVDTFMVEFRRNAEMVPVNIRQRRHALVASSFSMWRNSLVFIGSWIA